MNDPPAWKVEFRLKVLETQGHENGVEMMGALKNHLTGYKVGRELGPYQEEVKSCVTLHSLCQ